MIQDFDAKIINGDRALIILHPEVVKEIDEMKIQRAFAREANFVKQTSYAHSCLPLKDLSLRLKAWPITDHIVAIVGLLDINYRKDGESLPAYAVFKIQKGEMTLNDRLNLNERMAQPYPFYHILTECLQESVRKRLRWHQPEFGRWYYRHHTKA